MQSICRHIAFPFFANGSQVLVCIYISFFTYDVLSEKLLRRIVFKDYSYEVVRWEGGVMEAGTWW